MQQPANQNNPPEVSLEEEERARKIVNQRSLAAYYGKVMAEGGNWLMVDGIYAIKPAPKWVYQLMARGIAVDVGAWGKTLVEKLPAA